MTRIVLCYPALDDHLSLIRETAPDADVISAGQERIAAEICQADIYCGHAKVPIAWEQVVQSGRLCWIQSSAAGIDHCLHPAVIDSGVVVTSAAGLFAPQVAEHAIALLLGLLRQLPTFFAAQQRKSYVRQPTRDLRGTTVGIVGLGGNGREIARVLRPFDVTIVATDMFPEDKPAYVQHLWPAENLPQLLRVADIVVLCVPLTTSTRQMIGAAEFTMMKPSAMLVNVARGPVVCESDLVQALQSHTICAAGLDVVEEEPLPASSPLWEMPQVIITPHVAAQGQDRLDKTTAFFCENLRRFRAQQPLKNVVDKQLGFSPPDFT